ncbi:MAG: hypothetical protein ACK4QW_19530, partial [Alphaproteobacteria bacterium]
MSLLEDFARFRDADPELALFARCSQALAAVLAAGAAGGSSDSPVRRGLLSRTSSASSSASGGAGSGVSSGSPLTRRGSRAAQWFADIARRSRAARATLPAEALVRAEESTCERLMDVLIALVAAQPPEAQVRAALCCA